VWPGRAADHSPPSSALPLGHTGPVMEKNFTFTYVLSVFFIIFRSFDNPPVVRPPLREVGTRFTKFLSTNSSRNIRTPSEQELREP